MSGRDGCYRCPCHDGRCRDSRRTNRNGLSRSEYTRILARSFCHQAFECPLLFSGGIWIGRPIVARAMPIKASKRTATRRT